MHERAEEFWAYATDLCGDVTASDCSVYLHSAQCDLREWYACLTANARCGPMGLEGGEACGSVELDCR